jgi:hypothetical protein
MSQGDLYRLADSERTGIEVRRDGGFIDWAEIVDDWPFPKPQVPINRDRLIRIAQRYYAGQVSKEEA